MNHPPFLGHLAPNKVICHTEIVDDLNRVYVNEANTWCREHNPKLELKSTREYK